MHRRDRRIWLRGQKAEQVRGDFAFLDLPGRCPARPNARKEHKRTVLLKREPDWLLRAARRQFVFGEACKWHQAGVLRPEPPPPMRGFDVANVGDTRIGPLALEREHQRRHAPPRESHLSAVGAVSDDRRSVVGKMPGKVGMLPVLSVIAWDSARIARLGLW